MLRIFSIFMVLMVMAGWVILSHGIAGGPGMGHRHAQTPPLDYTLMGFKEQGAWYFPCVAPEFPKRIPPHYQTYGPPPPPCSGGQCAPVAPPHVRGQ